MGDKKSKNSFFDDCLQKLEEKVILITEGRENFGDVVYHMAEGSIGTLVELFVCGNLSQNEMVKTKNKFQELIDGLSKEKLKEKRVRDYLETMSKEL